MSEIERKEYIQQRQKVIPFDDPPINEFKLLTYNIFIRPPPIKTNDDDFKDQRLQQFGKKYVNDFDVIVFQELFGALSSRKGTFLSHCKPFGLNNQLTMENKTITHLIDGGVAIISRFKFTKSEQIIFSKSCIEDKLAAKGVLYGLMKLNQDESHRFVHIFGTHLQAGGGVERSIGIRQSQIEEALDFVVRKTKEDKRPIIFCGDLNVRGGPELYDDFIQRVEKRGFRCRDVLFETAHSHPITHGELKEGKRIDLALHKAKGPERRLDYIFVFEEEGRERIEWRNAEVNKFESEKGSPFPFLSDHYGISTIFSFPQPSL